MFSVTPLKRVHSLEYFKKYSLFLNSLKESNFGILCPQVLTVAGMAVLKIIRIPFSLIVGRYHFMLHYFHRVSFFLFVCFSHPTSKEENILRRLLGVLNSGLNMEIKGASLLNYNSELFLLINSPDVIVTVF